MTEHRQTQRFGSVRRIRNHCLEVVIGHRQKTGRNAGCHRREDENYRYGGNGDPDWTSQVPIPARKGHVDMEVVSVRSRHDPLMISIQENRLEKTLEVASSQIAAFRI